ncbi:MAG: hypothetical protein KGN84_11210 [Acidobacteriota bacterium]|nr:hypothetical protein [Acidobacteriota bacterium]
MAKTQRLRDVLTGSPTIEYLNQMNASGWKLVALEWERESEGSEPDRPEAVPERKRPIPFEIEVPYGMQISEDGYHLLESPAEMRVMLQAVDMIVADYPMSRVADELNREGFRQRSGAKWTAAAVFDLLPRMIEAGPEIFSKEEWPIRKRRLIRD